MGTRLPIPESELAAFCEAHGILSLALFGSTLKGTAGPESDVDLLVEFESGRTPGLFGVAAIEAALSALLDGRPVDLRTARDLSPYFREQVLQTAEVQYARH